ncbi:hypothetical protein, partial [Mycolicibacterium elephantis]|uniref:hypothetical protein n=1 Tax=Mycolicibacterium elephantis TaxID=81858 RepID=UPI001041E651
PSRLVQVRTPVKRASRAAVSTASARVAAEQTVAAGFEDASELLGEPHPTREQLFGRPQR